MKKKIKDLTEQEKIDICCSHDFCQLCPLEFLGNLCIRKAHLEKLAKLPKEMVDRYLEKEVKI